MAGIAAAITNNRIGVVGVAGELRELHGIVTIAKGSRAVARAKA
ncbi:hypothetical protein GCM10011571_28450 [Marinithermofilum abyssi]|jgi:hypothetical protein|uniref:Uncharacterized protein n=1 Tax=Marinithermofilum abyssi TaxID=1571185 RepID=A0A8J2VEC2_9BACL|nr:hypothetical protein GCM10011571_28450 [Marinithermofilum abyssi]